MSSQAKHEAEMIQAICPGVDEVFTPTGNIVVTLDYKLAYGYIAIGKNGMAIRLAERCDIPNVLRAVHETIGLKLKEYEDGNDVGFGL